MHGIDVCMTVALRLCLSFVGIAHLHSIFMINNTPACTKVTYERNTSTVNQLIGPSPTSLITVDEMHGTSAGAGVSKLLKQKQRKVERQRIVEVCRACARVTGNGRTTGT